MDEQLKAVRLAFIRAVNNDSKLKQLQKQTKGSASTFVRAFNASDRIGEILGEVLTRTATEVGEAEYKTLIRSVLPSALADNHEYIQGICESAQKQIDKLDGLSLGVIQTKADKKRINQIVKALTDDDDDFEVAVRKISGQIEHFSRLSFDDFIKANADFRGSIGMEPEIVRTYEGPHRVHTTNKGGGEMVDCPYCEPLAGVYKYSEVEKEVYGRHAGCKCVVLYRSGRIAQDVHSKRHL